MADSNEQASSSSPEAPAPAAPPVVPVADKISIDDFMKVELRVARVLAAERIPKSTKLLKLSVDTGADQRTIVAGIAGVEEQLDCGESYEGNAYVDENLPALPKTLHEAADLLDGSALARRVLGDAVVDFYVHTARLEISAFDNAVTDWERQRYFERI